jgi:putative hydrolase of the HAD superfamily
MSIQLFLDFARSLLHIVYFLERCRMTNQLPKAILFDMDDTILAYSHNTDCSWQVVCSRFTSRMGNVKPEVLVNAIKANATLYWSDPEQHRTGRLHLDIARQQIVARALRQLGVDDLSLAYDISLAYAVQREEAIEPFPGAIDTLLTLRERGVQLALLTNGSAEIQRRRIERHQLIPLFDYILIEGEFGVGKPDERVYLHALDQLKVLSHEAWMVGDNLEWEVAIPQRLGMFAIWLDVTGAGLPGSSSTHPDRIIRTLPELLNERL